MEATKALQDVTYPARRLGVKPARVYELCRQKRLPHVRIGRQIRFDPVKVEAWIEAGGTPLPGGWRREVEK